MLTKREITSNINTEWQISQRYLKESRYGLCRFINEVCINIQVSNEEASIAMNLTNYFFVKKNYMNYNRLTLACAAILLATKVENSQNKFNDISKEYSKYYSKIYGETKTIFKNEDIQQIKDKIGRYEIELLKTLDFDVPRTLPFDYIYVYSAILYPDNETDISTIAIKIAHDSFFTYANNLYKYYIVAIASISLAARLLSIPTPLDSDFKYIDNMRVINNKKISEDEFERKIMMYENKGIEEFKDNFSKDNYFDNLSISEKLHPYMKMDDLVDCMDIICEFYEDFQNEFLKNEKKKDERNIANNNIGNK